MQRGMMGGLGLAMVVSGCAVTFSQRSPWDVRRLAELNDEVESLRRFAALSVEEAEELRRAKALLDERLSAAEASVGYDERGLVTRLLDSVLFDSGKAVLHDGAKGVLDTVARALQELPDQPVSIEGHTDNVPITHSGWADNTALAIARAQAVAEYLVERQQIDPNRLTVHGYGEQRPIASNDTADGRKQNRRVEVILTPRSLSVSSAVPEAQVSSAVIDKK